MNPRDFAERALLGALLQYPGIVEGLSFLRARDFHAPAHQVLYATISDLVREHGEQRLQQSQQQDDDFDFWRDVIGDDLVVEGIAYDSTLYEPDGEGGVVERPREEAEALAEQQWREWVTIPEITPLTVHERLQQSTDPAVHRSTLLTGPGLHTLIATAPPVHRTQPESWALIVVEASIRRQVAQAGMRVGQAAESSELTSVLRAVDGAVTEVDSARHRWENLLWQRFSPEPPSHERLVRNDDQRIDIPDPDTVHSAEYGLVEHALAQPRVLDDLAERIQPSDFANQELGNTWRAAVAVHATDDRRVDPITVAWELQRQEPEHGPGLPVDTLATLGQTIPLGNAEHCAEVMLRGSLSRLTRHAAEVVTHAAQQPGLQPGDVLHTSSLALEAVTHTARRLASPAAQLARQAAPPSVDGRPSRTSSTPGERPPTLRPVPPQRSDRSR